MDLNHGVAVITGAASGFGRAFAQACVAEGMKVVLADVDDSGLAGTRDLLPSEAEALVVPTDVSDSASVQALADRSFDRFGRVTLLFNNAGVAIGGLSWESTPADWAWVLGVNLMGVVHGIQSFVPRMLAQGHPAHIINTASAAGLVSVPGGAVYCASKHAVVALSECLHQELKVKTSRIGVSVLCPSFVRTAIAESERNRPAALHNRQPASNHGSEPLRQAMARARITADDIARVTLDAVQGSRFYVLPHPKVRDEVRARMEAIIDDAPPTFTTLPELRDTNRGEELPGG
jgi:NAD(P)-dependent dehydrogenase (short-subunit alcohol dehydrogenase family)